MLDGLCYGESIERSLISFELYYILFERSCVFRDAQNFFGRTVSQDAIRNSPPRIENSEPFKLLIFLEFFRFTYAALYSIMVV
jgi:hypothetical protein